MIFDIKDIKARIKEGPKGNRLVWLRLALAMEEGRGARLTVEEIEEIIMMDDAIYTLVWNYLYE